MFALFACLALSKVQTEYIPDETEIDFGSASDTNTNDLYVFILNSGDFYDVTNNRQCPSILKNPGKVKFRHTDPTSDVFFKYYKGEIPKEASVNVIFNSITVPLILKPTSSPMLTFLVFISDHGRSIYVDSNNKDKVKYVVEHDGESHPQTKSVDGATTINVAENMVAMISIDRSSIPSDIFFMVKDIGLIGTLDSKYHYNCGCFYFTADKNAINLATDCADPTPKQTITKLEGPETDVYIVKPQKINVPANSFVTLIKLQETGKQINFKATDKNNGVYNHFPQETSIYFKAEGTLEISSEQVPYVRVNLINTENWPKDAKIYVKLGLSEIKFTSDVNEADTANSKVVEGRFILVSANNYNMPLDIEKDSDVEEKFYTYEGKYTNSRSGVVENYKNLPGSYVVSLPQKGHCSFVYKVNGFKYTGSDGFGASGAMVNLNQFIIGVNPTSDPNSQLYMYIGIGAGAAVLIIIIIIIICCCCCKKKGKKEKSSSSSSM